MLDLLQKVFYTSDAARESFVELCEEEYVQKAGRVTGEGGTCVGQHGHRRVVGLWMCPDAGKAQS